MKLQEFIRTLETLEGILLISGKFCLNQSAGELIVYNEIDFNFEQYHYTDMIRLGPELDAMYSFRLFYDSITKEFSYDQPTSDDSTLIGYYIATRDTIQAYAKTRGWAYLDGPRKHEVFHIMKRECMTFQHFLNKDLFAYDVIDCGDNVIISSGLIPGIIRAKRIAQWALHRLENFSKVFN